MGKWGKGMNWNFTEMKIQVPIKIWRHWISLVIKSYLQKNYSSQFQIWFINGVTTTTGRPHGHCLPPSTQRAVSWMGQPNSLFRVSTGNTVHYISISEFLDRSFTSIPSSGFHNLVTCPLTLENFSNPTLTRSYLVTCIIDLHNNGLLRDESLSSTQHGKNKKVFKTNWNVSILGKRA